MKRLLTLIAVALMAMTVASPVSAITDGNPDGNDHPMVGQLLFYVPDAEDDRFDDPGSWFTCTGTLLDGDTLLTAGHCAFGIGHGGTDVWVNFEEAPDYSILPPSSTFVPDGNDERYEAWSAALNSSNEWIRGTAEAHPDYEDQAFVFADVGMVTLDSWVQLDEYATVANEGYLEQFATKRGPNQRFTAVGYGLESGFPNFGGGDTRMQATMKLVSLNGAYGLGGVSVTFSSSPGRDQGGTCFGDSGGPVFEAGTLIVVAVTSFGVSFNCVEPGGFYRVDTAGAQNFINQFT